MGLNDVSSGERVHIGFFGKRNAGKSSLVNAVTGQDLSVVSQQKGTTTDAVTKSMELLPLGPVVIMDTPGFDDEGSLGEQRVRAARKALDRTDLAVLVTDEGEIQDNSCENEWISLFREKALPYLIVHTKVDLCVDHDRMPSGHGNDREVWVSALTGQGIEACKETLAELGMQVKEKDRPLVHDLIREGDLVILVLPQDKAAPKGRLILPEQMMIRDVLDAGAIAMSVQLPQLSETLTLCREAGRKPALVITDSQVFAPVAREVPEDIALTSFSILMARYKGILDTAIAGVQAIDHLEDGSRVLISEGCTHHRQCGDIGTVKLPALLTKYTGKLLSYTFSSGNGFPDELTGYDLVIHCGGCMLGPAQLRSRMALAKAVGVPFTNYGTAIAYMRGILERSLRIVRNE